MRPRNCDVGKSHRRGRHHAPPSSFSKTWRWKCWWIALNYHFSVVFSCDIWNVLIFQIYFPSVMVFCAMGRLEITPFPLWWIAAKLTVERFRSSELASPLNQQFWKYSTHCWKNTRKTKRKVQRIPWIMPQLITSTMRLKARMKMRESSEWKKDIFWINFNV